MFSFRFLLRGGYARPAAAKRGFQGTPWNSTAKPTWYLVPPGQIFGVPQVPIDIRPHVKKLSLMY